MFEKRHYEFLANWLKNSNMAIHSHVDRELIKQSLADWLKKDNSKFDRERFLKEAATPTYPYGD